LITGAFLSTQNGP
jgi:hypothetical protein